MNTSQCEIMDAARKRADRRRRGYERALDCLHVRLLPPLMGISLALTLVFMAAWLDDDLQVIVAMAMAVRLFFLALRFMWITGTFPILLIFLNHDRLCLHCRTSCLVVFVVFAVSAVSILWGSLLLPWEEMDLSVQNKIDCVRSTLHPWTWINKN